MTSNKRRALLVTGVTLAAFLQGCIYLARIEYSQPTVSDTRLGNNRILAVAGLKLQVFPVNMRVPIGFMGPVAPVIPFWVKRHEAPFRIMLLIDPEGQEFTFDPEGVMLQMDGQDLQPIGFTGPSPMEDYFLGDPVCTAEQDPQRAKSSQGQIAFTDRSCFFVMFDIVPPSPGQSFIVSINGIKKGNKPVSIPSIHFEKKVVEWHLGRASLGN